MSLYVFEDPDALARGVTDVLLRSIQTIMERRGICHIVLAGGNTPRQVYTLLARKERHRIDWAGIQLYWGDERFVALEDPASNYRMARESLLDHLPIPAENVHPMPVDRATPAEASMAYEQHLRALFPDGRLHWDIVLLGLGTDGHTASLFPGTPALTEKDRWVVPATAPTAPRARLTLTFPAINQAKAVYFLVSGASKAKALRGVLGEGSSGYPAEQVQPSAGTVDWWVDEAAAAGLEGHRLTRNGR